MKLHVGTDILYFLAKTSLISQKCHHAGGSSFHNMLKSNFLDSNVIWNMQIKVSLVVDATYFVSPWTMSMKFVVKKCDWLNWKPIVLVWSLIFSEKVRADAKVRMRWSHAISWMKSQWESYITNVLYIRTYSRIACTVVLKVGLSYWMLGWSGLGWVYSKNNLRSYV